MKLLRYGPAGQEEPGLLDADGKVRGLSSVIHDIDAAALSPERLRSLAAIDARTLPFVSGKRRIGVPVRGIGKFIDRERSS